LLDHAVLYQKIRHFAVVLKRFFYLIRIRPNSPKGFDINKTGLALVKMRATDKSRVLKVLGSIKDLNAHAKILKTLQIMFGP